MTTDWDTCSVLERGPNKMGALVFRNSQMPGGTVFENLKRVFPLSSGGPIPEGRSQLIFYPETGPFGLRIFPLSRTEGGSQMKRKRYSVEQIVAVVR